MRLCPKTRSLSEFTEMKTIDEEDGECKPWRGFLGRGRGPGRGRGCSNGSIPPMNINESDGSLSNWLIKKGRGTVWISNTLYTISNTLSRGSVIISNTLSMISNTLSRGSVMISITLSLLYSTVLILKAVRPAQPTEIVQRAKLE